MKKIPDWQYNELEQIGVDYCDPLIVREYDRRYNRFRNVIKENEKIVRILELRSGNSLIDMGTGTGAFAIYAAKLGIRVYAVEPSLVMLDCVQRKAKKEGLKNISFHHGGFLTYEHKGEMVDAVVSQYALHHLPDFWKQIGLNHVSTMLKTGGRFFLKDVVLSFNPKEYQKYLDEARIFQKEQAGEKMVKEFDIHMREEFSTWNWIMEGIIRNSGFFIEKSDHYKEIIAQYTCSKISS